MSVSGAGSSSGNRGADTAKGGTDTSKANKGDATSKAGATASAEAKAATKSGLCGDVKDAKPADVKAEAARVTSGDAAADTVDTAKADAKAADAKAADAKAADAKAAEAKAAEAKAAEAKAAEAKAAEAKAAAEADAKKELGPLAKGPEVAKLQSKLAELGYEPGPADGKYGPRTARAVGAFQGANELSVTGKADAATLAKLDSPDAKKADPAKDLGRYAPGSPEQVALFEEAARQAGLPESWATSPGLEKLLAAESGGVVGKPNYTYGKRAKDPAQYESIHDELKAGKKTAKSSATGLGQLILDNVDKYYPSGRLGIGDPKEEAIGMLKYISDRYGTPDRAWSKYGTVHEGY